MSPRTTKRAKTKSAYAFIDAANLFYGGEKSLGWKIDYRKLLRYLKQKYQVDKAFYYAGVELFDFPYSPLESASIDLQKLHDYLAAELLKETDAASQKHIDLENYLKRVDFYRKLEEFGYELVLKPTKIYKSDDGESSIKKANCDVDMTLDLVRYMEQYNGAVVMSGDGDFVSVLKYLKEKKRKVTILSRGERSAKEIRQLAGKNFRDFNYLREIIRY